MTRFGWYTFLFFGAYMATQFWLVWRTRNQEGRPAPRLDDVLEQRYLEQRRLILYFWRPGCHICGPTSMVINPLLEKRKDIVKINALEERELMRRFGVAGTPTLVVINDGRIERVLTGSRNEQQIRDLVGAWDEDDDDGNGHDFRAM
jgi:thioredoxin 1